MMQLLLISEQSALLVYSGLYNHTNYAIRTMIVTSIRCTGASSNHILFLRNSYLGVLW